MAEGDAEAARGWLRAPTDPDGRAILPRFPLDIADEVLLARIALATQDDELAQLALSNSRRRAELNPGIASIAATAAHVRGLLEPKPRGSPRGGRSLRAHTATTRAGGRTRRPRRRTDPRPTAKPPSTFSAVRLALYTELGATWDARRVRSRLRELGVRRRLVTAEPETSGWAALTTSELAVARLVAEGLTNREVAERLFVSPHTVNSHLRHVFAKLGINSRVELARLARDYEMA